MFFLALSSTTRAGDDCPPDLLTKLVEAKIEAAEWKLRFGLESSGIWMTFNSQNLGDRHKPDWMQNSAVIVVSAMKRFWTSLAALMIFVCSLCVAQETCADQLDSKFRWFAFVVRHNPQLARQIRKITGRDTEPSRVRAILTSATQRPDLFMSEDWPSEVALSEAAHALNLRLGALLKTIEKSANLLTQDAALDIGSAILKYEIPRPKLPPERTVSDWLGGLREGSQLKFVIPVFKAQLSVAKTYAKTLRFEAESKDQYRFVCHSLATILPDLIEALVLLMEHADRRGWNDSDTTERRFLRELTLELIDHASLIPDRERSFWRPWRRSGLPAWCRATLSAIASRLGLQD